MSSSPTAVTEMVTVKKRRTFVMHKVATKLLVVAASVIASGALLFPPARASAAPARTCQLSMRTTLKELSDSVKLPVPALIVGERREKSYYISGFGAIVAEPCASKAVLAHEFGHFVIDVAGSGTKSGMFSRSALFKKHKNWLLSTNDPRGAERAAHCVANVLGVRSAYTRCPSTAARRLARLILAEAQQRAAEAALADAEMEARIAAQYPPTDG